MPPRPAGALKQQAQAGAHEDTMLHPAKRSRPPACSAACSASPSNVLENNRLARQAGSKAWRRRPASRKRPGGTWRRLRSPLHPPVPWCQGPSGCQGPWNKWRHAARYGATHPRKARAPCRCRQHMRVHAPGAINPQGHMRGCSLCVASAQGFCACKSRAQAGRVNHQGSRLLGRAMHDGASAAGMRYNFCKQRQAVQPNQPGSPFYPWCGAPLRLHLRTAH